MNIFEIRADYIRRIKSLQTAGKLSKKEAESLFYGLTDSQMQAECLARQVRNSGVKVLAKASGVEIEIHGEIEQSTVASVREALRSANGQAITVSIDSCGGCALSGFSIYEALKSYAGPVTAIIQNAFSAASTISMAAKKILMTPSGFWMAHCSSLEDEPASNTRELMDKIDSRMLAIYSTRLPRSKAAELMNGEKFLSADECVRLGIVDGIEAGN